MLRSQRLMIVPAVVILAGAAFLLAEAQEQRQTAAAKSNQTWSLAGAMANPRGGACSVRLNDGRVLVAGGADDSGPVSTVDLFNADGSFSSASPMSELRQDASCSLLEDGQVLVAGGQNASGITNSAEIYNPDKDAWRHAGAMIAARAGATATTLKDQRVLFAGGRTNSAPADSLEIFDPATGVFSAVSSPMSSPRTGHAAALLRDGTVLIAGGSDGAHVLKTVDIFDPANGSVRAGVPMSTPRTRLSATTLLDNSVLFAGGSDGTQDLATAEVFNPKSGKFGSLIPMSIPRSGHSATVLPRNNTVLIAGGASGGEAVGTAEIYIPWQRKFASFGQLNEARAAAVVSPFGNPGQLMVAGGRRSRRPIRSAETTTYATLTSNLTNYLPGQTIVLSGAGWQPGETVEITLHVDPTTHLDVVLKAQADELGKFTDSEYVDQQSDWGVTFYVTSLGLSSGRTAGLLTFTDGGGTDTLGYGGSSPAAPPPGAATTYSFTATNSSGGGQTMGCVTLYLPSSSYTGTPTGTLVSTSGKNWTVGNGTAASGTSPGYVTFQANSSADTIGSTSGSNTLQFSVGTTNPSAGGAQTWNPSGTFTMVVETNTGVTNGTGYGAGVCKSNDFGFAGSVTTYVGATTTTVTSSPSGSSVFGQPVTFTARVSNGGTAVTPTGSVTFYNASSGATCAALGTSTSLGTGTLSGTGGNATATYNSSSFSPGAYSILACYGGDTGDLASSNTAAGSTSTASSYTVNKANTTTTIGSYTPTSSTYGTSVTFNVSVAAVSPGAGTPTGTVKLVYNTATICTATLTAGAGSCSTTVTSTSPLPAGSDSITAQYQGDTNFNTSTSSASTETVSPKTITVSGVTVNAKTYDGTTTATLNTGSATLSGVLSGDASNVSVSPTGYTANFNNANQGTGKAVTVTGLSLTGSASGNYTLTQPTGLTGTVNAATVTVSGLTANNKTYDGATTATLNFASATLSGVVAADQSTVTLSTTGYTANFNNATQGTGKAVTVSGLSLNNNTAGNYTLTQPTGLTATINPATVTVSGVSVNAKTYDGATTATLNFASATLSGVVAADQSTVTLNTTGYTANFNNKNQGTGKAVTVSGLSLNNNTAGNYTLTQPAALTGTINPATVTISGLTVNSRTYDGTTTATLNFTSATLSGVVVADQSSVTLVTTGYTANFNNANQGTGKAVTVSGLSLNNNTSANYTLTQPAGLTGTINPATVTISGITVNSKTYDGTTAATLNFASATLSGVVAADQSTVTLNTSGYTANFNTANQGTGKAVTVSGLSLNNNTSANYTLTQPAGLTGAINPASVTVTGITANSKTYDGTTAATLNFASAALSGVVAADQSTVTLNTSGYTATFNNANQGTGKAVTVSSLTLNNNTAGNYTLTQPAGLTAAINPASVTVTGVTANSKTYDGATSATLNFASATLSGVVAADQSSVTLNTSGYTANFNTANQGTGKAVTVSGLSLNNNTAGNYSLTQPAGLTAAINPASVTVTGVTGISRAYDGTTNATLSFASAALSGVVAADQSTVTLNTSGYTASFNNANQGAGKPVTVSGLSLNNNTAGNYSLTQPSGVTASITAVNVTVSGVTVNSKGYDGATTATLNFTSAALSGVVAADQSTVTLNTSGYAANFNNANQGTGKTVTVSGLALNNNTAGNYTLTQPAGLTGTINPASVTVSGITVNSKTYDGTTGATLNFGSATLSGVAAADQSTVTLSTSGYTANFNNANQGAGKPATVSGLSLNNNTAGNYSLTQPAGLTGSISAVTVTVTGITANNKPYDGGTSATLNLAGAALSGVAPADQSTVTLNTSGYTATFNNANQGTGKPVTVSGLSLNNNTAGNYTLTQPAGLTGNITPVTVTVTGISANNKPYDGTTSATLNFASAVLSGVAPGDQSTVTLNTSGYTANFSSANQGTGLAVTVSGLSLNNNAAGNYALTQPAGLTGNITPVTVTVTGITANNKPYDGATTATLNFTSAALSGVAPADQSTVTLNTTGYTASFGNANQGTGKAVTLSGLSLNNNTAGNYALTQPAGLTANITPITVTVTGITANNKPYDGTTSATLNFASAVLSGVAAADQSTVTLNTSDYVASFNNANQGTGKPVSVSGVSLNNDAAGNYSLTQPLGLTAMISPVAVTASGITANNKPYDGATSATLNLTSATLSGVVAADQGTVTLNSTGYAANFNDANQGTGKPVTVSGLSLSNNGAGNYTFTQPAGLTATITPAAVTVSGISVSSKTYDGTVGATLSFTSAVLSGVLPADQSSVTLNTSGYTASFNNANQGTGKPVIVTGLSLNNNGAGNYTFTQPAGLTGVINPVTVTVTGIGVSAKGYDGATTATLDFSSAALSGVLAADQSTVTLNTSGYSANFASANPGTGIPVTVSGLALNNNTTGNYTLTQPAGLTGTINSTTATVSITGVTPPSSTYGQVVTFSGTVTGSGATPTGTVSVYYGTTLLCQATLSAGAWSCGSSTLPAGTDSVTATYSGNGNYGSSTSSPATVVVAQAAQTVSFTSTPPATVYATDPGYLVSATGGASGNPVTFSTSGSCAVSGNTVSWTGAGVCVIKADQAGNSNYQAAHEVMQTILVNSPLKAIGSINQVALTWLPYPGNTGYTIYRQTGCTGSWTAIATAASSAITYVDLTAAAATPGPLYCYYLTASGFSPNVAQTPVAAADSITSAGFKGKTTTTVSTSNTNSTKAYATVNSTIATGSVAFIATQTAGGTGTAVCSASLTAGVAQCNWNTPLTPGTWTVTASYQGSTTFAASIGNASITF